MNIEKLPTRMPDGFILIQHIAEKKVGSLYVTEDKTNNPVMTAEVIKAYEGSETKVGETLLVNSNAGISIQKGDQDYLIIREKGNVFAIL